MDKPRRRVQVRIEIDADSWADAIVGLVHYQQRLSRAIGDGEQEVTLITGHAATWGGTLEADEDPSITHDAYFEAVDEYLGRKEGMG